MSAASNRGSSLSGKSASGEAAVVAASSSSASRSEVSKPTSSPWSTYLLKRVPEGLKADIAYEAAAASTSPANVVRSILCAHFDLDCPPRRAYLQPPFKPEENTIFIRLQPPLHAAIREEAASRNTDQREVMLSILRSHFGHNGGNPHD